MSDQDFFGKYFERHWIFNAASLTEKEQERINVTLALIPQGVKSILDVGCGDGRVTNNLITRYDRLVGLDSSHQALRNVKAESIVSSVGNLPFSDKSFDLVICSEVLEHLPYKIYPLAITEIQRVSAKYIIITVPNSEERVRQFVTCPHCGCVFHSYRHLRSYTVDSLVGLFGQFSLEEIQTCLVTKSPPTFFVKLGRKIHIIPDISFPYSALCPQCGYSQAPQEEPLESTKYYEDRHSVRFLRLLSTRLIPGKRRGGWLLALYRRE